jgi:tetratricopeptide (TPR) repeat protein
VLQWGLATSRQIEDARGLVEQMKKLGVERDLLGALVDRKVIEQAAADKVRAQVASTAVDEVVTAEVVEDQLNVAPDYRPGAKVIAAPGAQPSAAASCYNHPESEAVAFCVHCRRPVCVHCVIRTEKGAFCSEACAVGAEAASEARVERSHRAHEQALKLGGYARWVAVILIVLGIGWVVKWFVDDYSVSFALQRAKNKGDNSPAGMASLKRAVNLRPKRADLRVRLGRAYIVSRDAGLAIQQFEKAIEYAGRDVESLHAALHGVADAYVAKGMHKEASGALLRLRDVGGADSDSERRLGLIFRDELDNPKAAVEAFNRALKVGSESRELHYEVGRACFAEGRLEEAMAELRKATAPLESGSARVAADAHQFLGNPGKMAEAYSLLVQIAEKKGDVEAFGDTLEKAQKAVPGSIDIVLKRARFFVDRGEPDKAVKALMISHRRLSRNTDYLDLLSKMQAETGARKEALGTLRALHSVAPNRPDSLERLVRLEASVGDPARAMKLMESMSAERRASDALLGVWTNLIRNQLARGRVASAEKMLNRLGAKAEDDPKLAAVWCEVLHRLGRDEEALERAELALSRTRKDPAPHLVVGSVLRSVGRTREALERVRAALRLGAKGTADIEMAMLCWQGGLKNRASRSFAKALSDPGLPESKKEEVRLYLSRMREPEMKSPYSSDVIDLLHSRARMGRASAEEAIVRGNYATYGMARAYGMLTGSIGPEPIDDELDRLRKMSADAEGPIDARALLDLHMQSDKMLEDASRALTAMYPRAADDIGGAVAEYRRRLRSCDDEASKLAAASSAHMMALRAALGGHPRAAELQPALDIAARKMKARTAMAPGSLQEAIAADLASMELLAAAIAVGPGSFMFETAVRGVLSDLAAADVEIPDPLSQFSTSRAALFRMLWVFTAQGQEMGSVSELSAEQRGGIQ